MDWPLLKGGMYVVDINHNGLAEFEKKLFTIGRGLEYTSLEEMAQREYLDHPANIPSAWFKAVVSFLYIKGYVVSKR